MTLEVFFTADDFGLDSGTNAAIVQAHRRGALHGASLMMGQPGTEEAVALARENPGLVIGWHLHLCDSKPVTRESWPWGKSPGRAGWSFITPAGARLMREEVAAQWDLFQKTGLECGFVNCHHHLHSHPMVYRRMLGELPNSFHGWVRMGEPRFFDPRHGPVGAFVNWITERRRKRGPHRSSDTLWGMDRIFRMNAAEVARVVRGLSGTAGLHEFMFHPRRQDGDLDFEALLELKAMGC